MAKRDYYEILGLSKSASQDEIKKAYRKLAVKYHPDRNPDDKAAEDKFKEATEAYEVLSDSQKRQRYDQFGHEGVGAGGFGGAGGFSGGGFSDIFGDFEDIFGEFFGGGGRSRSGSRRRRGADLRYDLEIAFEDAVFGKETKIEIPRDENCTTCNGTGAKPGTSPETCTVCGGSGQITRSQGFFSFSSTCHNCGGTGVVIKNPCSNCGGKGKIKKQRTINIKIPAGVETGTKIKITGEGEAGMNGGETGDLYIVIHVKAHEFFERHDNNLYCEIPITVAQAALGTEIFVTTIGGKKLKLKIPEGTQTDKIFRLRGNGVPSLQGYGTGDMHVKVIVETPTNLNAKQKELLEEFARSRGEDVNPKPKSVYERLKDTFS